MKKKMYVLGVAALVAAMLALSGVAQSAMWVGAELGGNFPSGSANTNFVGLIDLPLTSVSSLRLLAGRSSATISSTVALGRMPGPTG